MNALDAEFWNNRYLQHQTGWDIGAPSTPLIQYTEQYADKSAAVLIPGCGNAYEAAQLLQQGFQNITVLDISTVLANELQERFRNTPVRILNEDFFEHEGHYDLILEQTFFCALHPSMRKKYVQHMTQLLKPGGKLAGVLFNRSFEGGPPFGGNKEEYLDLFSPEFTIKKMELCTNSIPPRQGAELFFIAERSAPSHLP